MVNDKRHFLERIPLEEFGCVPTPNPSVSPLQTVLECCPGHAVQVKVFDLNF